MLLFRLNERNREQFPNISRVDRLLCSRTCPNFAKWLLSVSVLSRSTSGYRPTCTSAAFCGIYYCSSSTTTSPSRKVACRSRTILISRSVACFVFLYFVYYILCFKGELSAATHLYWLFVLTRIYPDRGPGQHWFFYSISSVLFLLSVINFILCLLQCPK